MRFYPDLAAKRLTYCAPKRIEEAGGSLLRVLKFYRRGYIIPLDSLAAVIARLTSPPGADSSGELQVAGEYLKLLRMVDPEVDPTHEAHEPSSASSIDDLLRSPLGEP